jgi:hypothetical protein
MKNLNKYEPYVAFLFAVSVGYAYGMIMFKEFSLVSHVFS